MKYFSYQPDIPLPECLHPDSVRIPDPDTVRLMVAPNSETPQPDCPLEVHEPTPTGDLYDGQINGWRWEGLGSLKLPSGVRYQGEIRDGRFHGTGTLFFPTGSKYEGQWNDGVCTNGLYTFADGLSFADTEWRYCHYPDRRYWSEVQQGLKPAGRSQLVDQGSPRPVPLGMLDAGDGLYDPQTRTVYDYDEPKKIRRVVTDPVHHWITARCRKGGDGFQGWHEELLNDIAAHAYRGGQSKPADIFPDQDIMHSFVPPTPENTSKMQLEEESAPGTPEGCREHGEELVRGVMSTVKSIATSVHGVVTGAMQHMQKIQDEAHELVGMVEEHAFAPSSLIEEAKRRLSGMTNSSDTSSPEWSSNSGDGSKTRLGSAAFERRRRSAYSGGSSGSSQNGSGGRTNNVSAREHDKRSTSSSLSNSNVPTGGTTSGDSESIPGKSSTTIQDTSSNVSSGTALQATSSIESRTDSKQVANAPSQVGSKDNSDSLYGSKEVANGKVDGDSVVEMGADSNASVRPDIGTSDPDA